MDTEDLLMYIDHERWLLNNNMISDTAKNTLYLYGALLHTDVRAVELDCDFDKKLVSYQVYVTKKLLKKLKAYSQLSLANNVIELWRLRRLLKKEGNLNFRGMLNRFVKDFCGPRWEACLEIRDAADYHDGYEHSNVSEQDNGTDKQSDAQ